MLPGEPALRRVRHGRHVRRDAHRAGRRGRVAIAADVRGVRPWVDGHPGVG